VKRKAPPRKPRRSRFTESGEGLRVFTRGRWWKVVRGKLVRTK
jgi:hypothetical protein